VSPRLEILGRAPDIKGPLQLDAVLRPYRSLSSRGFNRLMLGLGVLSLCVGAVFVLKGAWPVFGFFGLDVLLVWLAFRVSYAQAKLTERVRVAPGIVHVARIAPNGRARHWGANPTWLKVEHEKRGPLSEAVGLVAGGRRVSVGRFLAPEERESFADALRQALYKANRTMSD
jgi:uncharacterized membrane protein